MKKLLFLGTLFFSLGLTAKEQKARLDSQGKDYWTVEFKKIDEKECPDIITRGPYAPIACLDSHQFFGIGGYHDSICLSPGETSRLYRKKFNFRLQALYTKKVKSIGGEKQVKRKNKQLINRLPVLPFGITKDYKSDTLLTIKQDQKFTPKQHYITIELRKNPWPIWPFGANPIYRITTRR